MEKAEVHRALRTTRDAIARLDLNLNGLNVLTEVGSGFFALTPLIAALAGAERVFAWTRDSVHGTGHDVVAGCREIGRAFGLADEAIEFAVNDRPVRHVVEANIITNLGFVRPINSQLLTARKGNLNSLAIPIMCEAWEARPSDLDVEYCLENGVRIAGTWENHPSIKVFDSCGALALKMAFDAGYEVSENRIVVWSSDPFGEVVSRAFRNNGATVTQTNDLSELDSLLDTADFIFFCDYHERRKLLGKDGVIDPEQVVARNPGIGIVHLYGDIDSEVAEAAGIRLSPLMNGTSSTMSRTLAYLGMLPMIRLHAAGLKVGVELLSGRLSELSQRVCTSSEGN